MRIKRAFWLTLLAVGMAVLVALAACAKKKEVKEVRSFKPNIVIVYWAELMGQLEPSGWGVHRSGGLARLANYVMHPELFIPKKQVRKMLVIEGGNLFMRRPPRKEEDIEQAKALAKFLAEAHRVIGYHPVGVGDIDLYLGHRFLKKLKTEHGLSLTCANLFSTVENVPLVEPYRIEQVGRKTVAIIGLLGNKSFKLMDRFHVELPKGYIVQPPKDAFARIYSKLQSQKPQPDLYLILAHMTKGELKELVPILPKNAIVFRSNMTRQRNRVVFINHVPVIETGRYGRYISKVDVQLTNKTDPFTEQLNINAIRVEIGRKLKKIDEYKRKAEKASPAQKERLGKVIARMQQRVDALKAELKKQSWSPNMVRITLVPMDKTIGDEATVKSMIEKFKAEKEKGSTAEKVKPRKPRKERIKTITGGGKTKKK